MRIFPNTAKKYFGGYGVGSRVSAYGIDVKQPRRVFIKKNVKIDGNVLLNPGVLDKGITIKDGASISWGAMILAGSMNPIETHSREQYYEPIVIEKEAWIGSGAIVLPGVTIGERAVVGAGAVVTKDVSPKTLVVGNPAYYVKQL